MTTTHTHTHTHTHMHTDTQQSHTCNTRAQRTHMHTDTQQSHTCTQMCRKVYGDRLVVFEDIRSVYDFDTFVDDYRPDKADRGIKRQFAADFEVRSVNGQSRVFCRTKPRMADRTRWSPWVQMYPSLMDLTPHTPHAATAIPDVTENNVWEEFDAKVCPTLTDFYDGTMKHGITIPDSDKEEMLHFLTEGPPDAPPPSWISWPAGVREEFSEEEPNDEPDDDDDDSDDDYAPFLHLPKNPGGRTCRCGSDTHMTVNSHACPLNPRYVVVTPNNNNDDENNDENNINDDEINNDNDENNSSDDENNSSDNENEDSDDENDDDNADDDEDSDDENDDDNADDGPIPNPTKRRRDGGASSANRPFRRPRTTRRTRRTKREGYKSQEIVQVDFNGTWWEATILYKHRGKYAVKYSDNDGNVEKSVPHERIRLIE